MSAIELRCGRWQDVLSDVECDALITDPPYSVKTHAGFRSHDDMIGAQREQLARNRAARRTDACGDIVHGRAAYGSVGYEPISEADAAAFAESWAPRTRQWAVLFGDHITWQMWEAAWKQVGWYVFAPLAWIRTGGTPRFQGDGPCNALEWICVARPRRKTVCGSLPGFYQHDVLKGNSPEKVVTGGKPLLLMQWIIADYSRPGDLVCDPCAGGATTLLAAAIEGRRAIGAERDSDTFAKAQARIAKGYTPVMRFDAPTATQEPLFGEEPTP